MRDAADSTEVRLSSVVRPAPPQRGRVRGGTPMKNMKTRRRVFLPCSSPMFNLQKSLHACKWWALQTRIWLPARQPLNSRCSPGGMISTPPHATRHHPGHLQPQPDLILMKRAFPFSKSYRSLSHPIAASPISDLRLRTCLVDCASSDSFKGSVCKAPTSKATCCLFCLATPSCRRWLALHRSASSLRTPPPSETSRRASPLPPA